MSENPVGRVETTRIDGLAWLSWLRVLAIFGVVCIHGTGWSATEPDARHTLTGQLAIGLDFCFRWAVPVFVMLSGTLLLDPARHMGAGEFLRKRALRLVPAIIVWHAVYLIYRIVSVDSPLTASDAVGLILKGKLWTALYFFWIVLGLALVTPVLIPWIASTTRRAQVIAGGAAALIPVLTLMTVPVRGADAAWVETPWTWWVPYLGFYVLGYALRDVVLSGGRLMLAAAVAIGGSAVLCWQWANPEPLARTFEKYSPCESYYSLTVLLIAISVYLLARALIRPQGRLRGLTGHAPTRVGRRLGDATLGVFAVHQLVLDAIVALPGIGGEQAADSAPELVLRCVLVIVGAYVIALAAARIPLLRRIF
jgi:surface polysaccharide O-acyltransferase-like enzyme